MKKVLSLILVLVLAVSCATCAVSVSAAQTDASADGENEAAAQPPTNGTDGPYEDGWVYEGSSSGGRDADLAPVGAGSISENEIEVKLTAVDKIDNTTVDYKKGATVCLYVGTKLRDTKTDDDGDGIVKIPIGDLKPEEFEKATISAYHTVQRGKAQDGNARDNVYTPFYEKDYGIVRYEYELHSETIDDNGNWLGEKISDGKKADVVFVIDSTGSMGDEIASVKNNIASFAETLIKAGVDVRFSIIDYRDITIGEPTTIHSFGGSKWTSKLSDVTSTLTKIKADGGGDIDETPIDALGAVTESSMNWRSDAKKYAFLYTDAGYKTKNNHGYIGLSDLATALKIRNISTSVITTSSYKSTYSTLYTSTNGIYANLAGSFSTSMQELAQNILRVSKRKITLCLQQPRIKYNLTACYLADTDYSKSGTYRSYLQQMLRAYSNNISQTTDGHVFINKIYLFPTNSRDNFFDTSNKACMADIQIQGSEKADSTADVQVWSNAHPGGFYTSTYRPGGHNTSSFKGLSDSDITKYKSKSIFTRIQMSAKPNEGGYSLNESPTFYSKTLTHESGHYIFCFYDEYGYYGINKEGKETLFEWGTGGVARPSSKEFGLMENQYNLIEMSNMVINYAGLACLTNKTRTNSTGQYYKNNGSCEDTLANLLSGIPVGDTVIDTGIYKADYTKVSKDYYRTAPYPYLPVTFVNASGGIASTGAAEDETLAPTSAVNFDAMTDSTDAISDTSYAISGSTVTFTLTPQSGKSYSAYYKRMGDEDYTAIPAVSSGGKRIFTYTMSANSSAEIRLVETGTTSRYVKYYIDASPSTNTGYIYSSVDGTTQAYENVTGTSTLYHISDSTKKTNGNWFSVNNSTYISADSPANINGGEIYSPPL